MSKDNETSKEQRQAVVGEWIKNFSESGVLRNIDSDLLKAVLVDLGANPEVDKFAIVSLQSYTNAGRARGMRDVWGEKFQDYKKWAKEWADIYESTGKTLPRLGEAPAEGQPDTRSATSGMIQFFGEITAYAYGTLPYEEARMLLETRILNGALWEEDKKDERVKIVIPGDEKPTRPSSIPPGFAIDAWEYIKSH